ncbi:zinc finger protein 239-like isoform X8 [Anopheles darlingi]|uniref:zinc finger protein 239-like isoform X8 n=1 Tax=Anopheles darlingi TaxID=43151 RepID=UPI0021000C6E|nr:zinc finger protein 239-like isoform X8 [Anopheles darlingi]
MEVLGEISNFCRFCLSQDCELLMPLSSAIKNLSFSFQDIQQTTGVLILESEIDCLTVCTKCSTSIELAVDFRRSCIEGNVKFLQLFGHIIDKLRSSDIVEGYLEHIEYEKYDPLKMDMVLQNEPSNEDVLKGHDEPALPMEEPKEFFDERTFNGQEDCEDERSRQEDLLPVRTSKINSMLRSGLTRLVAPDKKIKRVAPTASNRKKTISKERIGEYEEDKADYQNKSNNSNRYRKRLCGICGALVTNLMDHTRSHTKENLLKCPHCPVQMANNANLLRHVRAVHEKLIIKSCEQCDKGFTSNNAYKSHMRTYHNIGEQYKCEICLKMFNHASSRRIHMKRMHIAERKYECQICQEKFKDPSGLRGHARVHSTNAPYACSHCPKRFKSPQAKKTHEITHSGIKFACTLCTKVYRYKTLLNMHYRKCHPEECIEQQSRSEK